MHVLLLSSLVSQSERLHAWLAIRNGCSKKKKKKPKMRGNRQQRQEAEKRIRKREERGEDEEIITDV